jgi:hypothetical protein
MAQVTVDGNSAIPRVFDWNKDLLGEKMGGLKLPNRLCKKFSVNILHFEIANFSRGRHYYVHHKSDISTQPLTTHLVLPQIFLGRKVPISDVNCNFHVLEGGGCAIIQISTRFSKFEQKFSNI